MIILTSDTSAEVFVVLIASYETFKAIHEKLCIRVYSQHKCKLHAKELPSRLRRNLAEFVSRNIRYLLSNIIDFQIGVVKGRYKSKSSKILELFNDKIKKFSVSSVIIASDFDKYIKQFSRKIITADVIVNDKAIPVQVADVIAYSYRRTRNQEFMKVASRILVL